MALPALKTELENGMEERIARLEVKVEHIQSDVSEIKADIRRLDAKIDGVRDLVGTVKDRILEVKDSVNSLKIWAIWLYMGLAAGLFSAMAGGFMWMADQLKP